MIVLFVLADVSAAYVCCHAHYQILEQPSSTPRIAKSVDCILELCSEATVMRMTVMLVWPLLIAGVFALPAVRPKVISLFEAFQGDYFEDLVIAVSNPDSITISQADIGSAQMLGRTVETH